MLVCLLHASRQLKNGVYSIIDIPRDGLGAPWFAIGPLLLSWKTLVATPKKDRAKSYKHRIALYCWLFVHLLVFLKSKKSEESTCLVGVFFAIFRFRSSLGAPEPWSKTWASWGFGTAVDLRTYLDDLTCLVGGWPTPLKNDGLRQLGWHDIPNKWKNKHVPKPQPDVITCYNHMK